MELLSLLTVTTASIYGSFVLMAVTAIFIVAQLIRDNSIMDVCYGPIFALCYWCTWFVVGQPTGVSILIGVLVTLWALRLGVRIARKNIGRPEDARYARWRTNWQQRGQLYFVLRSYLQINLLQGVIIWVVATPLWFSLVQPEITYAWLVYGGALVWLLGLGYETTADWQLDRFIAGKKAGTITTPLLTTGLFRYSRRPNYFGESLVWWGLALIALSAGTSAWFVLFSPLVITYIVTRVTGPMLESMFLDKYPDAYRAYMARTNYFIPGRPRTE